MTLLHNMIRGIARGAAAMAVGAMFWTGAFADEVYEVSTVAEGLDHPWSIAFLPNGDMLVTERPGRLRVIRNGSLMPDPIGGVPNVYGVNQGGLLEVALDPDFASTRTIFISYAHGTPNANTTRLARATFDGVTLTDLQVIFEAGPMRQTSAHYGGRMAFLPDGTLLLTLGDGFDYREQAQVLSNHLGKVVRLNKDGSVPDDNPFVGAGDAAPEVWSYGHRNVQGIVYDAATNRVYTNEHGPQGGDELNLTEKGKNYGWPVATYGLDYSGARISPYTEREGTEQPLTYWVPSIAPSGMAIYNGDKFPQWQGDLFVSALVPGDVRRIDVQEFGLGLEETLFAELEERIRQIAAGPDGYLYLLTDNPEGRVLKVTPKRY